MIVFVGVIHSLSAFLVSRGALGFVPDVSNSFSIETAFAKASSAERKTDPGERTIMHDAKVSRSLCGESRSLCLPSLAELVLRSLEMVVRSARLASDRLTGL